ncbi:glucosaminidase domain-containing protein [Lentilactobacillus sp. Marseille-Q4993]|uniref:glucosaminidase domain-containing protein n=1 Tax=Lentilactobacillus sp. Marseille-Q4993 TaxID=3039492 RepID=UPI0024BC9ABF|nr:glucosaminidase domain-containing protein [Lentilactobacillus sp. Marseille-Q4993]
MKRKLFGAIVTLLLGMIWFVASPTNNARASVETDFINIMKDPVIQVSRENHLYASVMMAQAMLESNSGQSDLSIEANNFFGVKGNYDGESVTMRTQEMKSDGKTVTISAQFKKYPTILDSIKDNAYLLRHGTSDDPDYYSGTWTTNTLSASDAAYALSQKYATDMAYGHKLNHLIKKYHLEKLDGETTSVSVNDQIAQELKKQLTTTKKRETEAQESSMPSKITNRKIIIQAEQVFKNKQSQKQIKDKIHIALPSLELKK